MGHFLTSHLVGPVPVARMLACLNVDVCIRFACKLGHLVVERPTLTVATSQVLLGLQPIGVAWKAAGRSSAHHSSS